MRKTARELMYQPAWYLFGGLMLLVVAILSLMPIDGGGVNDKVGHLLIYAFLGGWFAAIARSLRVLFASLAALVGYGILIELLQGLTGYRYAEFADVVANTAGCAVGGLTYLTPLNRWLHRLEVRFSTAS